VVVVGYDGVRLLDVAGPLEVFSVANEQGDHYAVQVATAGRTRRDDHHRDPLGRRRGARRGRAQDLDTLVVAGSPNWELLLDVELVGHVGRPSRRHGRPRGVGLHGTFALAAAGPVARRAG
jgi:putative intracellular protease/amidase